MTFSNKAVPHYYGEFREQVLAGDIPVCKQISLEMNRIDKLIENPGIYYDSEAIHGFIKFCEAELTLRSPSRHRPRHRPRRRRNRLSPPC